MPDLVNFDRLTQADVQPHKVYLRTNWADAWTHIPYLYCDEATWSVAPAIPTASLTWRFGHGQQPNQFFAQWYARLTGKVRQWVKIVYETHPIDRGPDGGAGVPQTDPLVWVGSVETDATQLAGAKEQWNALGQKVQRETGLQSFTCYGLAHTLNRIPIDRSYWHDADGVLRVSRRPFVFNCPDATGRGRGNKSIYQNPTSFSCEPYVKELQTWSTRSIVQNLITSFPVQDCLNDPAIVTILNNPEILPDTDYPVFDPVGMSLWEALCNLVARTRMLGFHLQYVPGVLFGNADLIAIQPYSLAGAGQTFGDIEIPANDNQVRVAFETDPDIQGAGVKGSSTPAVDQYILRGARRTSTCSLSDPDDTLLQGWPTSTSFGDPDELEYEVAGSADGDYAGMASYDEQEARNREVRASARLHDIFRFFVHRGSSWDQLAGDGEGGQKHPVFPDDGDQFWVNPRELFILPCVLLEEGRGYETLGSLSEPIPPPILAPNANNRQPPLCFVKIPAADSPDRYWVEGSKLAENAPVPLEAANHRDNRRFSLRTEVPQLSHGLYLHVVGQPQHAIAYADFAPLPIDKYLGQYKWQEFIVTVSFEDDRHCEGIWPPDGLLPALFNPGQHLRRQVLLAGDAYRQDWIVPGTVVGVNPHDGTLQRNTAGGWIANDSAKLQARARQIHAYFSQPRRALTFSTGRINSALQLGDYITERGDLNREPIGAVITQMTVNSPEGGEIPRLTYDTAYLELEAVQL